MKKNLKIGNAQAFWGDRNEAALQLLQQQPDLDYLTLDYLSEVSLSIMAAQRAKDPQAGYAKDFLQVVKSLVPLWKSGSRVKLVTNAGGLAAQLCAQACHEILKEGGVASLRIAVVSGDDVLGLIQKEPSNPLFNNLENNEPIAAVLDRITTANAYLGARPIAEALSLGADLVITGRTADPSLTVGPCMAHFGWSWTDYDKIAQATVAGHLIECGTQATGGVSTDWLDIPNPDFLGFPFVEMDKEAGFVLTKPENTGGRVSTDIVKEQLLYEIGDPAAYLSPDATVSLLSLQLEQAGENRVRIAGAAGKAPPSHYKVSATYRDGYRAEGMLAIFGRECERKAKRCGELVLARLRREGWVPEKYLVECLGCGDLVPGVIPFGFEGKNVSWECLLRISIADQRKEVLENFTRQIAPLVTSGPQGTTGYTTGRPSIRSVFGYWPCLIEREQVVPKISGIRYT